MAGGTLSDVFQQSRHLILGVREGLERLERLESHSSLPSSSTSGRSHVDSAPDVAQNLKRDISQLQTYSAEMDRLWRSQMPKAQRDLWKRSDLESTGIGFGTGLTWPDTPDLLPCHFHSLSNGSLLTVEIVNLRMLMLHLNISEKPHLLKLEQVAEEVDSLKVGLDKYLSRRHKRQMEAKERAELLQRMASQLLSYSFILQSFKFSSGLSLRNFLLFLPNGDSARVLQIFDEEAQAMQSARNSSSMLDEAYATGVAVLSKYAEQRDRLKLNDLWPEREKRDEADLGGILTTREEFLGTGLTCFPGSDPPKDFWSLSPLRTVIV
eukprot:Gb_36585 [translate_table: standard]